jgi:hypothetical protein
MAGLDNKYQFGKGCYPAKLQGCLLPVGSEGAAGRRLEAALYM